jgi:electron transport complex protein RnfG
MSEQKLPMAHAHGGGGSEPSGQAEASSFRLIATLAVAGALAGMAIVTAYMKTKPAIDANAAAELASAVTEVLGGATSFKTVYILADGTVTAEPSDTAGLDKVFVGYDDDGQPRGVAIQAAEPGFQDVIDLIFGYDPSTQNVIGMKVLQSLETPGLGARITNDSTFISQFNDASTPLIGVKEGQGKGNSDEVVMITGSTISSRAVIRIIDDKLDAIQKSVDAYWATLATAPAAATETDTVTNTSAGGGA